MMRKYWVIGVTSGFVAALLFGVSIAKHKNNESEPVVAFDPVSARTIDSFERVQEVEDMTSEGETSLKKEDMTSEGETSLKKEVMAETFNSFSLKEVNEIGLLGSKEQVLAAATKKAFAQLKPDMLIGLLIQQREFKTAFAVLNADPSVENYDRQYFSIFAGLAQADAAAAAEIYETNENPELKAYMLGYLAQCWADQDVKKGFDWLASMDDEAVYVEGAYIILMEQYTTENPSGAAELVGLLDPGLAQSTLLMRVATELSRQDAPQALSWLNDLNEKRIATDGLLDTIVQNWAFSDPAVALDYVRQSESSQSGLLNAETIGWVMNELASRNPAEAAQAFHSLPENAKALSAQPLAHHWMQEDPERAYQWISSLTAEEGREHAVKAAASHLMNESPAQALEWAASIKNEQLLSELVNDAVWSCPPEGLDNLRRAIASFPLSETDRISLNNKLSWRLKQDQPTLLLP